MTEGTCLVDGVCVVTLELWDFFQRGQRTDGVDAPASPSG